MAKNNNFLDFDSTFWKNLEKLNEIEKIILPPNENKFDANYERKAGEIQIIEENVTFSKSDKTNKKDLLKLIDKLFCDFLKNTESGKMFLKIPNRSSWKNITFEKGEGMQLIKNPILKRLGWGGKESHKRLVLLQHLLTKIYKLIETNSYRTKRELFYEDVRLYKSQAVVDRILDDISCMLGVSKINFHVLTTPKGCVIGNLKYKDSDGNYVDCSQATQETLIPSDIRGITNIQSVARFILLVEKSAAFQMLVDSHVTSLLGPCIMITGKGFPDVNTREMLKKIADHLQIPVMGLFDADPYGIEILSIYKYGSKAMAFDVKNLAVPKIHWLGLLPTDIQRLNLPAESATAMTARDLKKAQQVMNLPYVQYHAQWALQIRFLLETKKKAEIEGLCKLGSHFLPAVYLPNKIKFGGWI